MIKSLMRVGILLFCIFFYNIEAHATALTTASCSQADLQTALDSAQDGDIILIPAGTCTWSGPVTTGKAIVLLGTGIDQTTIINAGTTHLFEITTPINGLVRITGFTFTDNGGGGNNGTIHIIGTSQSWRIDHCKFNNLTNNDAIFVDGDTAGVVDNNQFMMPAGYVGVLVYHGSWNGIAYGDGSWSSPLNLGSSRAVFIENNIFTCPSGHSWAVDATHGGRYVFRNNTLQNVTVGGHGTEGTPYRGEFSYEIYNNTFSGNISGNVIHSRSGTGVVFNNTVTGSFGSFMTVQNHRNFHNYSSWGACDGRSPYDLNDTTGGPSGNGIYDSGVSTNTTSTGFFVTDSTKNWTTNQWVGYSVIDTTTSMGNLITSNTATILYVMQDPDAQQASSMLTINPGDSYNIRRALVCMDQIGRSTGDLITRPAGTTSAYAAWPNEGLEPVYAWNNVFNGVALTNSSNPPAIQGPPNILEGRDFYSNTVRPGYTPYTYPHPLTSGKRPNPPTLNP